jgi:hypothetical protein
VSGETVFLTGDVSGRIATYIGVLKRLPAEPAWVLVGGLAVNVRLGRLHRATNDVDTVSDDQPRLIEILVDDPDTERLSGAKVQFQELDVEVDVMESTFGSALPLDASDRAFALVRRWAMSTATQMSVAVGNGTGEISTEVELRVATRPALIALKSVSIPRRQDGTYPEKIGSDIQDLFRLVQGEMLDDLLAGFDSLDPEARSWIARTLIKQFSAGEPDIRYSHLRLRRYSDNADSREIEENDLAIVGELGAALEKLEEIAT